MKPTSPTINNLADRHQQTASISPPSSLNSAPGDAHLPSQPNLFALPNSDSIVNASSQNPSQRPPALDYSMFLIDNLETKPSLQSQMNNLESLQDEDHETLVRIYSRLMSENDKLKKELVRMQDVCLRVEGFLSGKHQDLCNTFERMEQSTLEMEQVSDQLIDKMI